MHKRTLRLRILMLAILAQAACSLPAQSQNFPRSTVLRDLGQATGSVEAPVKPRKPGAATTGQAHPGFSALTADECRKLGGKSDIDAGGTCKPRLRCTITHGNGDVISSCIDGPAGAK